MSKPEITPALEAKIKTFIQESADKVRPLIPEGTTISELGMPPLDLTDEFNKLEDLETHCAKRDAELSITRMTIKQFAALAANFQYNLTPIDMARVGREILELANDHKKTIEALDRV